MNTNCALQDLDPCYLQILEVYIMHNNWSVFKWSPT